MRALRIFLVLSTLAARPGLAQEKADRKPFSLRFVPKSSVMLLSVHPAELLEHKSLKLMSKSFSGWLGTHGIDARNLESWSMVACAPREELGPRRKGIFHVLVAKQPSDFKMLKPASGTSKMFKGRAYISAGRTTWMKLTDRTIVLADNETAMKAAIDATVEGNPPDSWKAHWPTVRTKPAACIIDFANFRKAVGDEAPPPGILSDLKNMWEKCDLAVIGLETSGRIQATAVAESKSEANAKSAMAAMNKGLEFLDEILDPTIDQIEKELEQMKSQDDNHWNFLRTDRELTNVLLPLLRKPMSNLKLEQDGKLLRASTSTSPIDIARASGKLAPIFRQLWGKAVMSRRSDNLRNIALAMHNYHDVYNRFPASSQMGKDGKGKHAVSWRVLLLPYLEQVNMYEAYKFDEPWDSPANRKVTANMPAVYRGWGSDVTATHSDYFVFVGGEGADTVLKPGKGNGFRQIIDGSSNTLLIVETRKAVHWANPEDIKLDASKKLPKLGGIVEGGFRIAKADGSTGFVKADADKESLWSFIIINDGIPTDNSIFGEEPLPEELER